MIGARVGRGGRPEAERQVVAADVGELLWLVKAVVGPVLGLAGADQPAGGVAEQMPETRGERLDAGHHERRQPGGRRRQRRGPAWLIQVLEGGGDRAKSVGRSHLTQSPLGRRLKADRQRAVHNRPRERFVHGGRMMIGHGRPQIELACVFGRTWSGSSIVVRKISRPVLPNAITVSL